MKFKNLSLLALCLAVGFVSCKKDDDDEITVVEVRDREQQQADDMDSLKLYLESHYYNKAEIEAALPNAGINDIKIIELEGATVPEGYARLWDNIESQNPEPFTYADTDYQFYILKLNQGGGVNSPKFSDVVRVYYEVFTTDDVVHDSNTIIPYDGDLSGNLIEGWRRLFPYFNTAEGYDDNGDGTVTYKNSGLGVVFLPSGLAYFSSGSGSISAYEPLIFKVELLNMAQNDHDSDGIPSYLEASKDDAFSLGVNTDEDTYSDAYGYLYARYNYIDSDDDGDGVLTKNEITSRIVKGATAEAVKLESLDTDEVLLNYIGRDSEGQYVGTILKLYDSDGDGTPDYLDPEVKVNRNE